MIQARTVAALREATDRIRAEGETLAFVPTMGCLHAGHLALVERARTEADRVVVSVFVNPSQFAPGEDLAAYPRVEEADCAKLEAAGVDIAFLPTEAALYPAGDQTIVELSAIPNHLCGLTRPIHFRGVATVCAKLFGAVGPDVVVFGEKDFQQLAVIRRMVSDLLLPIQVVGVATVREPDGLALSSRNQYLSPDERERACSLHRALRDAAERVADGERDAQTIRQHMEATLTESGSILDYVAVVDPETLDPLDTVEAEARALVAVQFGAARLIDNIALHPPA
jgi:pantoate--beta-alanine ligase